MRDMYGYAEEILSACGGERFSETLPPSLSSEGVSLTDPERVLQLVSGESLLSVLAQELSTRAGGAAAVFGTLSGLLLLSALWRHRCAAHTGNDTASVPAYLCTLSITATAIGGLGALLPHINTFLSGIHSVTTAAATTLCAIAAAAGRGATAAVGGAGMALLFSVSEALCGGVLLPLVRILCGCAVARALGAGGGIGGLSDIIRSTFLWLTGALMTLLCAVLSCQTLLARSADSLGVRAVKFALSGAVPVIGGAVSEAVNTVSAGFSLAGSTVGVLGIGAVLWQLVPVLVRVFLLRFAFSASAFVAELVGADTERDILVELGGITGFLCAVLVAESLLYVLVLFLVIGGK